MKPANWKTMTSEGQRLYAKGLFESTRGRYILGQALAVAVDKMRQAPDRHREVSNIEDMETLGTLFEPFFSVQKASNEEVRAFLARALAPALLSVDEKGEARE